MRIIENGQAYTVRGDCCTPGEAYPAREYNFGLQTIMEMQKTLGGLIEAVNGLKTSVEGQGKSIDRIKMAIYIAIGAGFVIGYFVDKRFDQIMDALAKSPPGVEAPQSPKPGK